MSMDQFFAATAGFGHEFTHDDHHPSNDDHSDGGTDSPDLSPSHEDHGGEEGTTEEGGEDAETQDCPEESPDQVTLDHDTIATLDGPGDEEEMDANHGDTGENIGDGLVAPEMHLAPPGIQQKLLWAVTNRL